MLRLGVAAALGTFCTPESGSRPHVHSLDTGSLSLGSCWSWQWGDYLAWPGLPAPSPGRALAARLFCCFGLGWDCQPCTSLVPLPHPTHCSRLSRSAVAAAVAAAPLLSAPPSCGSCPPGAPAPSCAPPCARRHDLLLAPGGAPCPRESGGSKALWPRGRAPLARPLLTAPPALAAAFLPLPG